MFTCGWCGTHYRSWQNQCNSCGGRMPMPSGMDAGPEPPSAPRRLPDGFALRVRLTHNIAAIIGLAFTLVGGLMGLSMIAAPKWVWLLPGGLLAMGLLILRHGLVHAAGVLDAFRNGRALKGKVATVRMDSSTKINNRHPWEIVYSFEVDGHHYEGKVSTLESATANRFQGRPEVWVLVVENRPERNTIYPPVK